MVDNLALSVDNESTACTIFYIIEKKLQLSNELDPPFTYLGLLQDYDSVDVNQCKEYIEIHFTNYINHVFTSHGWNILSNSTSMKPPFSIPEDCIHIFFTTNYTIEGSPEHEALEDKKGFI